ncbi:MAG: shikimate kinase [Deltaproteobacteria bacterium]|nr:MAG: shikimate kinase [Deltaproteobacteria bacterium]
MMGAGKSAAGARLAQRLGREFVDLDAELERSAGRGIAEIFDAEGEEGFRARERAAIESVAGKPAVVALGGGAIAQPGMSERLAASGTVVYLRARPETLLERVGDAAGRPLLEGLDREQRRLRIRALLARREPAYRSARIVVDTDGRSVDEVADSLARELAVE